MSFRRAYESSLRLRLKREHSQRVPAMQLMILLVFLVGGALEFLHHPLNMLAFWEGNPSMITVMVRAFSYALQLLLKTVLNGVPAVIALLAIRALTAGFVRDLYDTDGREEAEEMFHRHMFGMPGEELRPIMIVREGRIFLGGGSTYDRVGGPGLLIVYNDSAVILERGGRLTRIVSANISFLERFERIWEIIDLRHQRWPFTVSAMTKEGIPVSCEADVTFKIDDRYIDEEGNIRTKLPVKTKTPTIIDEAIAAELAKAGITEPLPYTEEAVFNAATSIWVRIHQEKHDEQLRKWTGRVMIGEVEGALRNILARYRLDWLMRPYPAEGPHPREQIRRQLEEKLTKALPVGNGLGARILQVDLGQIKVKDEIAQQWVEAWQAGWEQRALETRAEGEAMLARMDADQIYAQAEMVLLLIDSIRPFITDVEDFPPYLLAMRFVQTLRWMAYDPLKRVFLSPEIFRTLDQLEAVVGGTDTLLEEPISETERMVREGRRI
jgi:regulator of protease activity HflC (stomatin/prohibitin superfamily)